MIDGRRTGGSGQSCICGRTRVRSICRGTGRFGMDATLVTEPLKAPFAQLLSVPGAMTRLDCWFRTPPLFTSARSIRVLGGRLRVMVADVPSRPVKRSGPSVELEAIPMEIVKGGKDWPMSQVMSVGTHCAKVPIDVI